MRAAVGVCWLLGASALKFAAQDPAIAVPCDAPKMAHSDATMLGYCGKLSFGDDKSVNAKGCHDSYTGEVQVALANKMFSHCQAWCIFDFTFPWYAAYGWDPQHKCWAKSESCGPARERDAVIAHKNLLCEAPKPACFPVQVQLTDALMSSYCDRSVGANKFSGARGCDAADTPKIHRALANKMFEHCGAWCLFDYDDPAQVSYGWKPEDQCWFKTSGKCGKAYEQAGAELRKKNACKDMSIKVGEEGCIPYQPQISHDLMTSYCGDLTSYSADISEHARACDFQHTPELKRALANHMFNECGATCVYDFGNPDGFWFGWNKKSHCYDYNSAGCKGSAGQAKAVERRSLSCSLTTTTSTTTSTSTTTTSTETTTTTTGTTTSTSTSTTTTFTETTTSTTFTITTTSTTTTTTATTTSTSTSTTTTFTETTTSTSTTSTSTVTTTTSTSTTTTSTRAWGSSCSLSRPRLRALRGSQRPPPQARPPLGQLLIAQSTTSTSTATTTTSTTTTVCTPVTYDLSDDVMHQYCDDLSTNGEDRSSEARGCSETYTPFVQMSLANHMFSHCGAFCLYDFFKPGSVAYNWDGLNKCWNKGTGCEGHMEQAIIVSRREKFCKARTCLPSHKTLSKNVMLSYCNDEDFSTSGEDRSPEAEACDALDTPKVRKALANFMFHHCGAWCLFDFDSPEAVSYGWDNGKKCWSRGGDCGPAAERHAVVERRKEFC
ncbi:unnamed protein product [Effrenium voratum]|nr:unnamed protein product [Effrenium voratum]